MTSTIGILLAAGAGRRMGQPKALVVGADGTPWVVSAARTLADGGCAETLVVVGAAAPEVRELLADLDVTVVESASWQNGMASSLRTGLTAAASATGDAAVIHLVDLPDVGADVIGRIAGLTATDALARATYDGRPGHPVLIGRDHWAPISDDLSGDTGARAYLDAHGVLDVDCSDLATGVDLDAPLTTRGLDRCATC